MHVVLDNRLGLFECPVWKVTGPGDRETLVKVKGDMI